jgi:hypothetical protein
MKTQQLFNWQIIIKPLKTRKFSYTMKITTIYMQDKMRTRCTNIDTL